LESKGELIAEVLITIEKNSSWIKEVYVRKLVECIVKQIVNNPDKVIIQETKSEGAFVLEIFVAKEDLGKIIGKEGRVVSSYCKSSS